MSESSAASSPEVTNGTGLHRFLRALGPAIIVASVVLGPGSILASSKVGAAYGFDMVWVLILAAGLMMGMTALGARLGVVLDGTLCDELTRRIGRPFAALIGLTVFLVCACFQFSNNLGVLAALEPWLTEGATASDSLLTTSNIILIGLNVAIIAFLFGSKKLYVPIERLMMLLVGLMILAFFGNFLFLIASGGAPAANSKASSGPPPQDALVSVLALIGTTFSIAGAFYQAYLVREKGWGMAEVKRGLVDSVAGISVLGIISLVIMLTAAISFYGRDVQLVSVSDVARQLEPLFGRSAVVLFSLGIFAGAFSSFMVNAMIGGAMMADGLGFGGRMDSMATKWFTTAALLLGMCVALFVPAGQRVGLVIFAQAMVVTGFPLLAASMLYLASARDLTGPRAVPTWMRNVAAVGLIVVLFSAGRLGYTIGVKLLASPKPEAAATEPEAAAAESEAAASEASDESSDED